MQFLCVLCVFNAFCLLFCTILDFFLLSYKHVFWLFSFLLSRICFSFLSSSFFVSFETTFTVCAKQHVSTKYQRLVNKILFDIITVTPTGTLGLCCVYIAQLMTHTAIYTLPFTLQLCYKLLGILQQVTKSQRVHISSYNRLYTRTKNYILHALVRLLLILNKSRRIGSIIRSWFRLKVR